MELHQIRLDEKSRFTAAGAADNQHIFIAGIGWIGDTGRHGKPFGLGENDVFFKLGVHEGLYVLRGAP